MQSRESVSRILGRLEPSEASDQATLSTSKLKKPCASTSHGSGQGKLRKIREIKMPNLNPRTFSINPGIFVEACSHAVGPARGTPILALVWEFGLRQEHA
eukprot:s172_g24.t1